MSGFLVVVERTGGGFSAYAPDVPGCVAVGATREATLERMHGALAMHLAGLREDDLPVPEPVTDAEFVEVPA